jgi:hypothetical protein
MHFNSFLVTLGVSICLDVVLIETLDLDAKKRSVSTQFKFFSKSLNKNLDYLKKAWLSQFISIVSISLNNLDKNLDTAKSQLKSLNFKNLDREKNNSGLDMMDNFDGFQKLVSTRRMFSISISIGLDCRDPQG